MLYSLKYIFLFLVFVGYLTISNAKSVEVNSLDTVNLQLKWKHQFQFAGYYAAIEKGYYKEVGLHVNLLEAKSEDADLVLVTSGNATYGTASSDLLLKRNLGFPVVVLANIFQHSPFVFLSLKNNENDNIHEFSGKTLMLEPHAEELIAYLKAEQINIHENIFVPHTYSPNSLLNKDVFAISAYSTDEPFLLKEAGVEFNIYNPRSSGIDFYGDLLFTSEKEIEEHPERVNKFLSASLKGWEYALNNKDEIVHLIYEKYSTRHSIAHLNYEAARTQQLIMNNVVEIGYVNVSRWERIGEIYSELGLLPENYSLEGFLYEPYPEQNFWEQFRILLLALLIAVVVSFIAIRFYFLSKKLKHENRLSKIREKQLMILEKKYRNLAEFAPHPIVITTLNDGTILFINQKACDKFKINKQVSVNRKSVNFYSNPEDRQIFISKLKTHGYLADEEIKFKDAIGENFNALLTSNIIEYDDNQAVFSAIWDISDRIKLEEELKEVIASKDKFFSIIAHDLRTPFNSLIGFSELFKERVIESNDKDLVQFSSYMNDTLNKTYNFLNNLLEWSRLQTNRIEFKPTLFSLNEQLKEVLEILSPQAKSKKIEIVVEKQHEIQLNADRNMMRVVLINLISNAIKFSHLQSKIIISIESTDMECKIVIKDSGVGIEKDRLERIFDLVEGESTVGTDNENGTGLGLTLCKDFVEKNNGKIWVESIVGKGSTFYVSIPTN